MTRLFVAFLLGFALVWTLPAALRSATPLSLSDVQMGLGKLGIVQGPYVLDAIWHLPSRLGEGPPWIEAGAFVIEFSTTPQ